MSVKSIVIKVSFSCDKTKTDVLQAVAKLQGVNSINVDVEKGTVTIVGTVDPVCVITKLRKAKICAEITTVGPPKKPDPPKPKPEDCITLACYCASQQSCQRCRPVSFGYPYDSSGCSFW